MGLQTLQTSEREGRVIGESKDRPYRDGMAAKVQGAMDPPPPGGGEDREGRLAASLRKGRPGRAGTQEGASASTNHQRAWGSYVKQGKGFGGGGH